MKKALLYEIRRDLLPLVVFCVACALIGVIYTFTTSLVDTVYEASSYRQNVPADACLAVFAVELCILCIIVPVMQLSYRMNKRSADLWYSLPITRKKLLLVRVLGGLFLVFVPYTLAYWLSVGCIALRVDNFVFVHYLSFYPLSLVLGAGLFGVNAFLFTRANTVEDGTALMVLWACILPLAVLVCFFRVQLFRVDVPAGTPEYLAYYSGSDIAAWFFPYSPCVAFTNVFEALILGKEVPQSLMLPVWFAIPVAVLEGAGAYIALFARADRDRAENAGQNCSSWLGYRTLIPAYIVLLFGAVEIGFGGEIVAYVLAAIAGVAMYFVYRRSFRLKRADLICYAASVAVGIAVALLLHLS